MATRTNSRGPRATVRAPLDDFDRNIAHAYKPSHTRTRRGPPVIFATLLICTAAAIGVGVEHAGHAGNAQDTHVTIGKC